MVKYKLCGLKQAEEVQEVMAEYGVPFMEALRRVTDRPPREGRPYRAAGVAANLEVSRTMFERGIDYPAAFELFKAG